MADKFVVEEQANYIPPTGKDKMVYSTERIERSEDHPMYDTDEVYSLSLKINYDELLSLHTDAMRVKSGARVNSSGKMTDDWLTHSVWEFWQCRESEIDFGYIYHLKHWLELTEEDSIAFWTQQPWSKHRWHCDSVKCSLNILLGDDEGWNADTYGPIQYRREPGQDWLGEFETYSIGHHDPTDADEYISYFYQCALINSTHSHRAYAEDDVRKMFRFSIRSRTYEEMKEFLKGKGV